MARIHIGRSADLQPGGAIRFRIRHQGREVPAFAIRAGDEVRGFVNVCTHRALELDLGMGTFHADDGQKLRCLAHGALFSPDGRCLDGPCPQGSALTRIEVIEADGELYAIEDAAPEPASS